MRRPRQHIISTKSEKAFEQLVPDEWVVNPHFRDYGIDYHIEIFERNRSTGKTFYVQLKGTTARVKDDIFSKDVIFVTLEN